MTADLQKILLKQKIISLTRDFFVQNNFQEITTPVLHPALPLEQNIYSLSTTWQQSQAKLYLSTSPESTLKKLMANGLGDCFAISHSFRDLEAKSPTHLPEFLMLEWYQTGKNYLDTMDFCQNLITNIFLGLNQKSDNREKYLLTYQNNVFNLTPPWPKISVQQLFLKHTSLDLSQNLNLLPLSVTAAKKGYTVSPSDTWESLFNQIFLNEVEPHLPADTPLFITDYPSQISPLAKHHKNDPGFSQRFELYFGSLEIANGNTESKNSDDVTKAFRNEEKYRRAHKLPSHPADTSFIKSLSRLPPCSGCGLGLDRLTMLMTDTTNINQVNLASFNSDI